MADQTFNVQVKMSGGVATPIVTGDRRLTLRNIARLLNGIDSGGVYKLGSATVQVNSSMVAASATCTPASPAVDDTVSIAGTALTAKQGRATGTVTPGTSGNVPVEGDTITVNGVLFTAVNGAVTLGDPTFDVSGNTAAQCTSIAAQVNAYASPLLSGLVGARASATVVTFYAVAIGTSGNSLTLATSNNTRLAKSGTTFANGAALTNNQFDCKGTDVTTGASLASAINNSTTAAVQQTTASANTSTGVVTVTAKLAGVGGNAITFTSSSNTTLAVTGSGFLASGSQGASTVWTF